MAVRTYYICDLCKTESDGTNIAKLQFPIGREFNGVETETQYLNVDVCSKCLEKAIHRHVKAMTTYDEVRKFLSGLFPKHELIKKYS